MPACARGDQTDTVFSKTGTGGEGCPAPLITSTNECSDNVFVNGVGSVRLEDKVTSHTAGGCGTDNSPLTTASETVFVNGKGMGRIGDEYTSDNTIISASTDVFAA